MRTGDESGHAASEIARLRRLLAVQRQLNLAIFHSSDAGGLFDGICRALVDPGGLAAARIDPVEAGSAGPATEAVSLEPGERIFPVTVSGAARASLVVLARSPDCFHEDEIQLLTEVTRDIGFALESLDREAARRRAEENLRQERDFSAAVLDSLPGVLYLYDSEGRFLRWNKNFEHVTGLTTEEVARTHPLDLFQGPDRDLVASRIEDVFRTGASSVEAEMICRDGELIPHYFTGLTLELEGRTCLVGVGIDIRERRRAEHARLEIEARYRLLFDRAPDGIVVADNAGMYLDANASICRMLGYEHDEIVGRPSSEFVAPDQVGRIDPAIAEIRSGAEYHREWRMMRRNGTSFPAEVIAATMPDGSILGMVRDITERKQAEAALLELNASLERRVAERTAELEAARLRAESADRLKSTFLATMSHELRTPLNAIIGFTGIVLQGMAGPLNEEQSKQLGMVKSSARHLLELINDILDLSRIEAQKLNLRIESFDLREALRVAVSTVEPMARRRGLTIGTEVAPEIGSMTSDRRRVGQIILNLLNNAIKFTDAGTVTLRADVIEVTGKCRQLRLAVSDTGIGMQAEDLPSLFQPFRQLDTGLARQREGTGLGLVICRRLVELLGGTIAVESERGRGSTFSIFLPLGEGRNG